MAKRSQQQPQVGYMANAREHRKSVHFQAIKAAVEQSKMTVEEANEMIMDHSRKENNVMLGSIIRETR